MVQTLRLPALLCAALGLAACGDDDDSPSQGADATVADANTPTGAIETDADGGTTTPVSGLDAAAPAAPAAYAAATRIFSVDGKQITTYVQVLDSIDEGARVDTSKATEFGGPAELFGLQSPRWLAVGEGESASLTRYSAGADEKLQKQQTVSFASYGLQGFFSNKLYQVSDTKVYLPDPDSAQLIAFDPTTMKVITPVDLKDTARAGYTPVYSYDYVKRDGKVLFTVAWVDWSNDKILPETALVVLDTNTDKVVRIDSDTRCGGLTQPITIGGDTYFPSSSLAAAGFQLDRLTTEPCVLRVKAGQDAFDASYYIKLRELTGGAVAGEPVPASDSEMFVRVLDTSLASIAADTATYGLTGQSAWRWSRWNPTTNTLSTVDALAPSTANTAWFEVDGRVFDSQTDSSYANTTLIELNAVGGPRKALSAPGLITGLTRIQ